MRSPLPAKAIAAAMFVLSFLLLYACNKSPEKPTPAAVRGVIDTAGWDFKEDGALKLDGEWEFYPGILLEPSNFLKTENLKNRAFIAVPGLWKDRNINGINLPAMGHATYRLIIISGVNKKPKTLSINQVYSAYKLWVNGTPRDEIGTADKHPKGREDYVFIHNKRLTSFTPHEGGDEIILQVFNTEYKSGGIGMSLRLEDGEAASRKELNKYTINMIIVGLLLFVSVFNIAYYFLRKEEKAFLLTALFSLVISINLYNIKSPILSPALSGLGNPFLLDYITVILGINLYLMIVGTLYPEDFSIKILRLSQVISAGIVVLLFLVDYITAEKTINFFFIFCILCFFYSGYVFIKALINRKKDAILFLIGLVPVLITGINNALYAMWIINTGSILPFTMVIFSIMTTIIALRRLSVAQAGYEELSGNIEPVNISPERPEPAGFRGSGTESITIRGRSRSHTFAFSEIIYITSHSKNIVMHTVEHDIELPVLMKDIMDRLPPDMFIRIHKSNIINIRYIFSISHVQSGRYSVRLKDNDETELPVGRSFVELLRKKINK